MADFPSSASAPLPPPIDLGTQLFNSMGISFIGLNIALVLYGVISIQAIYYYRHWHRDPPYIRVLVGTLWALVTLHDALFSHAIYYYLISKYGDIFALLFLVWSVPWAVLLAAIISTLVNTFFLWRLWKLSKNRVYLVVIVLFEAGHISMYSTTVQRIFAHKAMTAALAASKDFGITAIVVDAVMGTMLSTCLINHLRKSRTGYTKSEKIISKLVRLTIATGSLTTFVLIFEIITWTIAPTHLYVSILNFLVANLYTISLLTFLNIRDGLRAGGEEKSNSLALGMRDVPERRIMPEGATEHHQFWIPINDRGDDKRTFGTSLPIVPTFDNSPPEAV